MNGYMGQIKGPFKANQELFSLMKENSIDKMGSVKHLGVQSDISSFIIINGEEIEIGKTGIYEVRDTEITSIKFKQDVDDNTLIDYVIDLKEDE